MEQLKKVVLTWHDHAGYSELMLLVLTVSLRRTKYTFISCLLVNAKSFNKKVTNSNVHTILLEIPNVRIKSGPVLNWASLLTTDADGEPHDYREVVSKTYSAELTWQAVVTEHDILASGTGPSHSSAQAAELVGLARACEIAKGQGVTISID